MPLAYHMIFLNFEITLIVLLVLAKVGLLRRFDIIDRESVGESRGLRDGSILLSFGN